MQCCKPVLCVAANRCVKDERSWKTSDGFENQSATLVFIERCAEQKAWFDPKRRLAYQLTATPSKQETQRIMAFLGERRSEE
jgi:hypothetical protein